MGFKRGFIVICIIICLFGIACACAGETTSGHDDLISNQVDYESDDFSEMSCESENTHATFTDLSNEISNVGDEFILAKDYRYDDEYDGDFKSKGIYVWSSSIVIDGNGHTIDGNNKSRAFEFFGSNVTIKNLNFINGFAGDFRYAGAISIRNSNCTIINCSFINNYATSGAGAIHLENDNQRIINCTFINNTAMRYDTGLCSGGAIEAYSSCSDCIISDCTFINNTSHFGGAIRWHGGPNSIVTNGIFINNTALKKDVRGGGAVDWRGDNTTIMDCSFANSTFHDIYLNGMNCQIIDCNCSSANLPIYHKSCLSIIVNDTVDFNETLVLKTSVASGVTGNISIYVNSTFKGNVNAGDIFYLKGLNSGVNVIKAVYSGNDIYARSEYILTVTVNKIASGLSLSDSIVFERGCNGSVNVSYWNANGILASVIGHPEAVINISEGVITVSGLDAGIYALLVTTVPDDNYYAVTKSVCIKINVPVKSQVIASCTVGRLSLTLTSISSDVFNLKAFIVNFKDTKNGNQLSMAVGSGKTCAASLAFTSCNCTKSVSVSLSKSTLKLTAKAKSFKSSDKTKKYAVTLKNNQNNAIKNAKATVKVNGKKYSAITNANGVASFKLSKLTKKGKYAVTVCFKGSKYYSSKTVSVKITVR